VTQKKQFQDMDKAKRFGMEAYYAELNKKIEIKEKGVTNMLKITRCDINTEWAHSGIIEAGGFVYTSYCVGNLGGTIEEQINGAFNHLEERLNSVGLTLESVVKFDALFKNIWDIPTMEKVIKERFNGKYPARKSIQTAFAHEDLLFQVDAVAYREGEHDA